MMIILCLLALLCNTIGVLDNQKDLIANLFNESINAYSLNLSFLIKGSF